MQHAGRTLSTSLVEVPALLTAISAIYIYILKRYVEHYGKSDKVDRVVIVWSNKGEAAPDLSMHAKVHQPIDYRPSVPQIGLLPRLVCFHG
jgi:hypothetical protein